MYYVLRQDIGSESDRTQCEEPLNSRYLHWFSSSIQHTAFLAISEIHCIRRNKNFVRVFWFKTSREETVVIVGKIFLIEFLVLKAIYNFVFLNDKAINLISLPTYVNLRYFTSFVSSGLVLLLVQDVNNTDGTRINLCKML